MVFANTISFIFTKTQQRWDGFDVHFTDEEAEAYRDGITCQGHGERLRTGISTLREAEGVGAGPDAWFPKWVQGTQ